MSRDLGIPVVPAVARRLEGMNELLREIFLMVQGETVTRPPELSMQVPGLKEGLEKLTRLVQQTFPALPNAQWIALRLLEGDTSIAEAIRSGEIEKLQSV